MKILCKFGARLRQEGGQSLVEFAVILPVPMLIILGILYFGRYEDYSNQETQLSEEGARWAAVNFMPTTALTSPCTSVTLQCYIQSQAQPELANGSSDVSAVKVWIYQPTGATYAVGQAVRVCVVTTLQFPFLNTNSVMTQLATQRLEATSGSTLPYTAGNPTGTMPTQCPTS